MKEKVTKAEREKLTEERFFHWESQPEVRRFLEVFEKDGNKGRRLLAENLFVIKASQKAQSASREFLALEPSEIPFDEAKYLRAGAKFLRALAVLADGRACYLEPGNKDYPTSLPKLGRGALPDPASIINRLLIRHLGKARGSAYIMERLLPGDYVTWSSTELQALAESLETKRKKGTESAFDESKRLPSRCCPFKPVGFKKASYFLLVERLLSGLHKELKQQKDGDLALKKALSAAAKVPMVFGEE